LLYEDQDDVLGATLSRAFAAEPIARAHDDGGIEHVLYRFDDPALHATLREFLARRPVVIADGHHRYETALGYAEQCRREGAAPTGAPSDFTLAYFANAYAPGSLLLPIHRVVKKGPVPADATFRERLAGWRETRVAIDETASIPKLLAAHLAPFAPAPSFAADDGSGVLRIFDRPRRGDELAIRAIHEEVIAGVFGLDEAAVRAGAIDFPKDTLRAANDVRAGRGAVALYLNALAPEDVFRVTAAGEILPQKSTFFLPKLPTGLLFRLHDAADA
jgi:uncharacterized protein (DUF1015 family)